MSYTIAKLPVKEATFKEIEKKLIDAGYTHAIRDDMLVLNGIGLVSVKSDVDAKCCPVCGVNAHLFPATEHTAAHYKHPLSDTCFLSLCTIGSHAWHLMHEGTVPDFTALHRGETVNARPTG